AEREHPRDPVHQENDRGFMGDLDFMGVVVDQGYMKRGDGEEADEPQQVEAMNPRRPQVRCVRGMRAAHGIRTVRAKDWRSSRNRGSGGRDRRECRAARAAPGDTIKRTWIASALSQVASSRTGQVAQK